jgi:hypothetical protein
MFKGYVMFKGLRACRIVGRLNPHYEVRIRHTRARVASLFASYRRRYRHTTRGGGGGR